MSLFTVEAHSRPVIVMRADDIDHAQRIAKEEWFRSDLMTLETVEGKGIWNGIEKLFVRRAWTEEEAQWDVGFAHVVEEGDADPADPDYICFLIPVRDPTDDWFEEDEKTFTGRI